MNGSKTRAVIWYLIALYGAGMMFYISNGGEANNKTIAVVCWLIFAFINFMRSDNEVKHAIVMKKLDEISKSQHRHDSF